MYVHCKRYYQGHFDVDVWIPFSIILLRIRRVAFPGKGICRILQYNFRKKVSITPPCLLDIKLPWPMGHGTTYRRVVLRPGPNSHLPRVWPRPAHAEGRSGGQQCVRLFPTPLLTLAEAPYGRASIDRGGMKSCVSPYASSSFHSTTSRSLAPSHREIPRLWLSCPTPYRPARAEKLKTIPTNSEPDLVVTSNFAST